MAADGDSERWGFINALDDELMKGGYLLPEWCVMLTRDVDVAFAAEAYVAAIITAHAAIEAYLRGEGGVGRTSADLITGSGLPEDLKADLNQVRRYRNRMVHIADPWDDSAEAALMAETAGPPSDAEVTARLALRSLRRVIYSNPWI